MPVAGDSSDVTLHRPRHEMTSHGDARAVVDICTQITSIRHSANDLFFDCTIQILFCENVENLAPQSLAWAPQNYFQGGAPDNSRGVHKDFPKRVHIFSLHKH